MKNASGRNRLEMHYKYQTAALQKKKEGDVGDVGQGDVLHMSNII